MTREEHTLPASTSPRPQSAGGGKTNNRRQPLVANSEPEQFSLIQKAEIVAAEPTYWAWVSGATRNKEIPGLRGRKPLSPDYVKLLLCALSWETISMYALITELRDPKNWERVKEALEAHRPAEYLPCPDKTPSVSEMKSFNARVRSRDRDKLDEIREHANTAAMASAREWGFFDASRGYSKHGPHVGNCIAMDGTVVDAAYGRGVDDSTGVHYVSNTVAEINKRFGTKIVTAAARCKGIPGSRIILSIDIAAEGPTGAPGGEGDIIVSRALALRALSEDGVDGLYVDSVIRGENVTKLARQGITTINFPIAQSNKNRATGGRHASGRVEKVAEADPMTHEPRPGLECSHALLYEGTVPKTRTIDDEGNECLTPLQVVGRKRSTKTAAGTYRYYHVYKVPCMHGAFEHREPLYPTDVEGGTNWGEYHRVVEASSELFDDLYYRRNDIESWHAQFKRPIRRMPVRGAALQSLYLSGLQVLENAQTFARLRMMGASPPLDIAA